MTTGNDVAAGSRTDELAPPRLEQVADELFAYIQPDGSWMINNAGFVAGPTSVVSIDTCSTEQRTRAYRQALATATQAPVRTVVNTHDHPDHIAGNGLFRPAAVLAHHRHRHRLGVPPGERPTAAGAPGGGGPYPLGVLFPGLDVGAVEPEPPLVTFTGQVDLVVDGLVVELHAIDHPAHTVSDVVAWVPERSVLYTGDLVFNGGTPFAVGGSLTGWLRANDRLRSFGATTIVPGHGELCGPAVLDAIDGYLRWVLALAERGRDEGLTPLEAARRAHLGAYGEWADSERLVANLHRAYAELDGLPGGSPMDIRQVFAEMVELNGGPLRCLA